MILHSKPFVEESDSISVADVVKSKLHAAGGVVKIFEDKISKFSNAKYAKATSSGTTAIHLSLLALGIEEGDEVILPSYVCQAVLNAVNYTKAKPILADINDNYHISLKTIKPLITKKTRAIIVPHLFGYSANIDDILTLKIPVIEDCAQSLGTKAKGKIVGTNGTLGIFSFFATKSISTGFGGMIITNSKKLKDKLNDLTQYDKRNTYKIAYNYGLTDIQAALGISQLEKLPNFIEKRKQIAERYDKAFLHLNIKLPKKVEGSYPFRYVITLRDKKDLVYLKKKLKKEDIITERPIFKPLHQYLSLPKENFPNTEKAHSTALSIPIYPALTEEEIITIISSIKNALQKSPTRFHQQSTQKR